MVRAKIPRAKDHVLHSAAVSHRDSETGASGRPVQRSLNLEEQQPLQGYITWLPPPPGGSFPHVLPSPVPKKATPSPVSQKPKALGRGRRGLALDPRSSRAEVICFHCLSVLVLDPPGNGARLAP